MGKSLSFSSGAAQASAAEEAEGTFCSGLDFLPFGLPASSAFLAERLSHKNFTDVERTKGNSALPELRGQAKSLSASNISRYTKLGKYV